MNVSMEYEAPAMENSPMDEDEEEDDDEEVKRARSTVQICIFAVRFSTIAMGKRLPLHQRAGSVDYLHLHIHVKANVDAITIANV